MKLLLSILLFFSLNVKAQIDLKFDKLFLDCEDKWVAVPIDSTQYYYGYVYLDNSAGLTFYLDGAFSINSASNYVKMKVKKIKVRIAPNKLLAAEIPADRFKELGITPTPEWLKLYKTDDQNVDRLFRLGQTYNKWGDAAKALKYLKQTKSKDKKYPGLDREFYYAYNGKKRELIASFYLGEALADVSEARQTNCELYKSLVFKQTNANELKQAEDMYYYAIKECTDETAKADMAYNIAFKYYKLMNKDKLKHWQNEVFRWIVPNDSYAERVEKMTASLN
ncbi:MULTISPECIES: hypothetical protein [Pedobacter]|uniref:hypothetical protein n=1 Tax=Pedobacter TaxID=84567 RepID=UPI001E2FA87E|nr:MULTISPECIES: hypothetical protein [Pedobacter]